MLKTMVYTLVLCGTILGAILVQTEPVSAQYRPGIPAPICLPDPGSPFPKC